MRELVVVRHGESEGNVEGVAQGELPYPLTARGREQAQRAARMIRSLGWTPEEVVSSPTVRCMQSAEEIATLLDLDDPRAEPAFTEIDSGLGTGLTFREMRERYPDLFNRPASEWLGFRDIGGESDDQLIARVGRGLEALPAESRVALVTHGAVFKGVLAHLLGFSTQFFLDLRNATCMRLERRRIGTSEVMAWTHLVHAEEWR